jgi:hypothetical protein
MGEINLSELVANMLGAAKDSLGNKWPEAKEYAESEFKKIGESILFIQKEAAAGDMSPEKAKLHMEIQKNASRAVLLTLEGLGILAVEAAINAALGVVRDTVNSALGFILL